MKSAAVQKATTARFKAMDALLIALMALPLLAAMALKALFTPPSSGGIEISGALIFFNIEGLPLGGLPVTETQVNSWLIMLSIVFLSLYLTHGIRAGVSTRRQLVAEWIVEKCENLVRVNMKPGALYLTPVIMAILALSAFSSLSSMLGIFPPTSDFNTCAGWAIMTFCMITWYKLKPGPGHYLRTFGEPVPFLAPLNIISEVATPFSMAFRHYGNILSGTVISILIASALSGLSGAVLGWLPFIDKVPLLRIGLPAVLSVYFDVFSGCLQAFIFAMLTMLYVGGAMGDEG